jgi:hypothetical protein
VHKFIIVLTYDVIMKLSTLSTGRYYIIFDITECGTVLHIYIYIWALLCFKLCKVYVLLPDDGS